MSIKIVREGKRVTIDFGEDQSFPVLERYSDVSNQDLTPSVSGAIVFEATSSKLVKVSPLKPTLRSVFSVLNSN